MNQPLPSTFNPVTPADLAAFTQMVGADQVLVDPFDLEPFSHDETEDLAYSPEVVLRPACTADVARILAHCHGRNIPVTPRGAGTGLSGGALPVYGGVSLTLERMNRILEIDRDNLFAVVEPGVITGVFRGQVEAQGLFYPPDPASKESCTMGGNLAECAGGPRAVKYGVTKDYVYGVEAVLADGRVINAGGKLIKNVSGYNLTQLLVGSEGTLAVITRIIVRLVPFPAYRCTLLAPFADLEAAARTVTSLFHNQVIPAACELLTLDAVQASEAHLGKSFGVARAEAYLLMELDGASPEALDAQMQQVGEVCSRGGAPDILAAFSSEQQNRLWELRRAMGEAVKSISIYSEEDTVVPRAALPQLVRGIQEICRRFGITAISYGHAGDGNLHVNILKRGLDQSAWDEALPRAVEEIFRFTVSLGGSITGEHGIGFVKRKYLPLALGSTELELMRAIKRVFDPQGILNPGKIFLE